MKYLFQFSTGFACDIYAELTDHTYTFESNKSKKELVDEIELRIHERGELESKILKQLENCKKKNKESVESYLKRKKDIDIELKELRERPINVFDLKIPSSEFELDMLEGIYVLKHGFYLITLDEFFNNHLI